MDFGTRRRRRSSISMAKNAGDIAAPSVRRESTSRKHTYFTYSDEEEEPLRKRHQRDNSNGRETAPKNLGLNLERPRAPSSSNKFNAFRRSSCSKEENHRRWEQSSRTEYHREWTYSSRDLSSFTDRFVVVSYNILGVDNASKHPDLYAGIPRNFLEWKWRKRLICEEIHRYDASILCFQEVDRFDDLTVSLQKDGFRGVLTGRTGEAVDGCATFWKEEQFTLVHQENIEFKTFGLRDNVAQLCILKMNHIKDKSSLSVELPRTQPDRSRHVLIGNTHVLFNPKRGDVKLGQIRLFVEKAYKLSEEWGGIPVILGGDLNSLPQSALYQFLASSELDLRLYDCGSISGQIDRSFSNRSFNLHTRNVHCSWRRPPSRPSTRTWSDEELRLATGGEGIHHLQHQFELFSAYLGVPGSYKTRHKSGEPVATSFHSRFMGTVDYIWHTKDLFPVRVLEALPIDILRRTGGLPSERWGSDHLALVCELAFADNQ